MCLQTALVRWSIRGRTMNSFVGAFASWVWGPRERREGRAGAELVAGRAGRALLRASPWEGRRRGRPRGEGTSGRLRVWWVVGTRGPPTSESPSGSTTRVEAAFLLCVPASRVLLLHGRGKGPAVGPRRGDGRLRPWGLHWGASNASAPDLPACAREDGPDLSQVPDYATLALAGHGRFQKCVDL